jgi:prolyl 4-hydroxylase
MTQQALAKEAVRAAYGWHRPKSWTDALGLLEKAAERGEDGARRQLELVSKAPIEELLTPPRVERLTNVAAIAACPGFVPPEFADWLIERAQDRLVDASVNQAGDAWIVRSARDYAFGPQERDLVLAIIQERAARLVSLPVEYQEPPNIISYEPGQEFGLHVDYIDPRVPEFQRELQTAGQRTVTIVTYLNTDFEGAETHFPDADVTFRGGVGDAVVFVNVLPDGTPDFKTRHCGLPPRRGRKWVLSQWIRSQPFPFRPEDLA